MVKLNSEQERIKGQIEAARRKYDVSLGAIEATYVSMKEEAKEPIRKLVGEALDAGIPQRQIHLAAGFEQISSLRSFLLPSKRAGGALLYTGNPHTVQNPLVVAQEAAKSAKPVIRQDNGRAYWIDPATGEERVIDRQDGPAYFYVMHDLDIATLTEQEQEWFLNDAKTLWGSAERDEYFNNGNEPARWDGQPDGKIVRR